MNETDGRQTVSQEAIATYKEILKNVLDMRPSGMRRHLAQRLGSNPSFVSQIANPSYPPPIPAGHVEAILEICHFSPAEREQFLAANRAHLIRSVEEGRALTLTVPDLGSAEKNAEFDRTVADFVTKMSRLLASD